MLFVQMLLFISTSNNYFMVTHYYSCLNVYRLTIEPIINIHQPENYLCFYNVRMNETNDDDWLNKQRTKTSIQQQFEFLIIKFEEIQESKTSGILFAFWRNHSRSVRYCCFYRFSIKHLFLSQCSSCWFTKEIIR